MRHEEDVIEIDLFDLLYEIQRKLAVILATALIFAGVAGVYNFFVADPVYQTTSKLYIQAQESTTTSLSDLQIGSTLAHDCVEMIQSRSIAEEVIKEQKLDMESKDLVKMLSVTNPEDTRIINITIEGTDNKQITRIANEYADVSKVRISEVMKTDKPQVWERAAVPENPVKPAKTKNTILGFLIGAMLSAMIVVVMRLLNDNIRTQDEIENYLELNMLAVVPYDEKADRDKKKRKKKNKVKRKMRKGGRHGK